MKLSERSKLLEKENADLRNKYNENFTLASKSILPMYWILIFYNQRNYKMARVVAYGLDSAIVKAKKEDAELEHYTLWWNVFESFTGIKNKFKSLQP
jgi:hypothetical protein